MGLDLGNLSISLDRFNEVASGKYNIGQLKLSENLNINAILNGN
jgi:hypothetical protein